MSNEDTRKDKLGNLESETEDMQERRQESEREEQQDMNQGTSTGTHDTVRHGVKWGDSYKSPETSKKKGKSATEEPKPLDDDNS
jgi:hypothetical protein